jgi:hypothetical protein
MVPPTSEEADAIETTVVNPAPPPEAAAAPPAETAETAPTPAEPQIANNFRLDAGHDPVTQLTYQILKEHQARGEHLRPSVAEAMAVERLKPASPPPAEAQPEATEPGQPAAATQDPAIVSLQEKDAALAERLKTAIADFDEAAQAEIHEERAKVGREIVKAELRAEFAREREEATTVAQAQAAETALAQSRAAVQAAYGQQAAQGTVMARLMQGIATEWEASGDPRFDDPRLPELAAAEAASQLGIQAGSAATAPPAAKPLSASQAAPRSTPPVAPPIAPGSARSSSPGTNTLPEINDFTDYYAELRKGGVLASEL